MKTVLAAIDFSAGSERVVTEAIHLARGTKARLVVLHVVQPPLAVDPDLGGQMRTQYAALASENAAEALANLQKKLQAETVTIQTAHLVGQPGQRVLDYAGELRADYIVLGSHGHGAVYDLVVGRTASRVIKHAKCPVLVVPPPVTPAGRPRRSNDRDR
jgi:nucleotide-binding universal stress UspA family protein